MQSTQTPRADVQRSERPPGWRAKSGREARRICDADYHEPAAVPSVETVLCRAPLVLEFVAGPTLGRRTLVTSTEWRR